MPYRIAILSKYPPLEGGIAAKTYWLARGLAVRGHMVHVITHGTRAGRQYRITNGESDPDALPNLQVHRIEDDMPWHIPEDDESVLALLDLTIRVVREHEVQILDTGYLVPYGLVGHLVKSSMGVCHVIRHGGSDLEKFLKKGILETVLKEAIAGADMVITEERHQGLLESINSHLVCHPTYVPDAESFAPVNRLRPRYRLASIGKINYYWQHKGLQFVAKIMGELTEQFECLVVGQGKGTSDFQKSLGTGIVSKLIWRPFIPPWEMPGLLNQLDGIFIFESGLPHRTVSNVALEALCSGIGVITDRTDFTKMYRNLVTIGKNQVLVVYPSESSSAAEMITQWVQERARTTQPAQQHITYQEYLSTTESVYIDLLHAH